MPWKVETVMSARKEFIALAQVDGVNMSELCRRMKVSRNTGYKWVPGPYTRLALCRKAVSRLRICSR